MSSSRKTVWLVLVAAIVMALASGCNDTLRQFITPVPGPGGDPGAFAHAIILSTNPAAPTASNPALGTDLHIDVSGDTVVGVVQVGVKPLFLGRTSNRILVLNAGAPATQTTQAVPPSVSSYIGLLPLSSPVSTVTLPSGTVPQGGGFSSAGNFYIVKSATLDPNNPSTNNAGMISSAVNAITATVPVGTNPVAIAGNSANNKIYVVNQGSDDVTVLSTIDNFVVKTIPVGASPIWGVMAPDGVHVFIVNQGSNSVSVIDTFLDQVIATIPVGISPNYAVFEPKNQRVYVSNTGSSFISVIKANGIDLAKQILPTLIANVQIPAPAVSVAALPDGTRAYAALGGCLAGTNHTNIVTDPSRLPACTGNQVAVIDGLSLTQTKLLTVGPGAVSIDAASNSSRVYVVSANDITTITDNVNPPPNQKPARTFTTPSVSIINTNADTVLRQTVDPSIVSLVPTFHVPQQDPACVPTIDSTFNTNVPIPCPLQIPFQVRVFP
jgi:YVTN family beta-propeller protein